MSDFIFAPAGEDLSGDFLCDLLQGWAENNPKSEEMGERLPIRRFVSGKEAKRNGARRIVG